MLPIPKLALGVQPFELEVLFSTGAAGVAAGAAGASVLTVVFFFFEVAANVGDAITRARARAIKFLKFMNSPVFFGLILFCRC